MSDGRRLARGVAALAVAVLAAPAAHAQVAVSLAISDNDGVQRDLAAALVRAARDAWDLLPATSGGDELALCNAGDAACLRKRAESHGATHLLVVGVAPLGIRDHILAVQLFDVKTAAPLFEDSVVQHGIAGTSVEQVRALATRLVAVPGPPPRKPAPAPAPEAPKARPAGTLTWVGAGLLGGGGAAIVATTAAYAALSGAHDPLSAGDASAIGIGVGGGLVVLGCVALLVDAL